MNLLLTSMEGHSHSNAPFCDAARPPAAPAVALPTAGLPIAPATTPLALVVPIACANSPRQFRHCSSIVSRDAISLLRTAWEDLTPSLDLQDVILAVNRRFGNSLSPLQSAADSALLAQRAQKKRSLCCCSFSDGADSGSEAKRFSKPYLSPRATSENCAATCMTQQLIYRS